jgi:hypothetical protein
MKNKNEHRRKLPVRAKKSVKRGKPVSVRSVSGLSYPVRGKLGYSLAER